MVRDIEGGTVDVLTGGCREGYWRRGDGRRSSERRSGICLFLNITGLFISWPRFIQLFSLLIFCLSFTFLVHEDTAESLGYWGEDGTESLCNWLPEEVEAGNDHVHDNLEVSIGETADDHGPQETRQRGSDANGPLYSSESFDTDSCTSHENDHDLATDHNGIDAQEEVVLEHALEDIELVVKATVVKLVKYLHPNEGVEDDCVHLTSK